MLSYLKRVQADRKIKFDELPSNSAMQNFWGRIKRLFSKKK
jgi:hypothetical protein